MRTHCYFPAWPLANLISSASRQSIDLVYPNELTQANGTRNTAVD